MAKKKVSKSSRILEPLFGAQKMPRIAEDPLSEHGNNKRLDNGSPLAGATAEIPEEKP